MLGLRTVYEKNIDDTINEIKLAIRSNRSKHPVFVLVEGIDDVKVYSKLFLEDKVVMRTTKGKRNIHKALEKLVNEAKQFIAIRDADFDHLNKQKPAFESLFLTDKHDIEMTMLSFPEAVRNTLREFLLQDESNKILLEAMQSMEYISYIRWFNEIFQCRLKFNFGIANFIKKGMSNAGLIAILNNRSKNKSRTVSPQEIDDFINSHRTDDYFNLCNGHDVISFISLAISGTSKEEMPKLLRSSFKREYFFNTSLYRNILAWQTRNGLSIIYTAQGSAA